MTTKTAWAGGTLNGGNGAYMAAFGTEINSLPTGDAVLSTISFDNTVATLGTPDQFLDLSFTGALTASETVGAGAGLAFFLYCLQADGATFGDGRLVAGTQLAFQPLLCPMGGIPVQTGTAITTFAGNITGFVIPPRKFAIVMQNNTGFALAATGLLCEISTYRQNVNA
jgi:hypothetical protein